MLGRLPQALQVSASSHAPGEASMQGEDERGVAARDIKAACTSGRDAPVFARIRPVTGGALDTHVPLNSREGASFETALFEGRAYIWAKHVASSPQDLFPGKKRLTWIVIKGRFKERVSLADLWAGYCVEKRLKNMSLIKRVGMQVASWAPGCKVGRVKKPYVCTPLFKASQSISVTTPKSGATAMSIDPQPSDDLRLLGPEFEKGTSADHRNTLADNHHRLCVNPGHLYTFHIWQGQLDISKFRLEVVAPGTNIVCKTFNLPEYLGDQPLHITAWHKPDTKKSQKLWDIEIYHKDLFKE